MSSRYSSIEMLRNAVAELEIIHIESAALLDRSDDGWRRELIGLRRRLQQQVQSLSSMFNATDVNYSDIQQLRAAFNQMRKKIALLQAAWPAVAIERDDPDYQASVREVHAANRKFFALVTVVLAREPGT